VLDGIKHAIEQSAGYASATSVAPAGGTSDLALPEVSEALHPESVADYTC